VSVAATGANGWCGRPTAADAGGDGVRSRDDAAGSRRRGLWLAAVAVACGAMHAAAADGVRVERADGAFVEGEFRGIDADGVALDVDGAPQRLAIADVRVVERVPAGTPAGMAALRATLVDGGWIEGTDLAWDGATVRLERPDGAVEIPAERVRTVAWRRADDPADAAPGAAWSATLPESGSGDLIVVASADGQEMVECAVKGVSAEAVTIVLDEETIPVKRAKVIGIHWLRPAAEAPGGISVGLSGGDLRARRVEWGTDGVVLDGGLRLPAAAVTRLDWSTGRSLALATTAPERVDVEPWFGGLSGVPGLAAALGPRVLPAGEGMPRGGLLVRPRTTAVWRIPPESRRFRAAISTAADARPGAAAVLVVAIDGREVERRRLEAGPDGPDGLPAEALDVDVAGGRRLSVTIDFGAATDPGCAVRLAGPVIEQ